MPLDADLDDLVFPQPDREKLFALFNELEFRKFAQEYAPAGCGANRARRRFENLGGRLYDEGKPVFIAYDLKSLRKEGQAEQWRHLKNKDF